jgi:hypothetical protein
MLNQALKYVFYIIIPPKTAGSELYCQRERQTYTAIADAHFRYAKRSHNPLSTPESAPERYAAYPENWNTQPFIRTISFCSTAKGRIVAQAIVIQLIVIQLIVI